MNTILTGCQLNSVSEVTIGMSPDHQPWEYKDVGDDPQGITVDIVKRYSEFTGRRTLIVWYEPTDLYKALSDGKVDCIISSLPISEDNQTLYEMSDPYSKTYPILLIGIHSSIISKQQLNNQNARIAVITDSRFAEIARSEYSNANIIAYKTRTEAAEAVKTGLCDVFIDDVLSIVALYKTAPDQFKINPAPLTDKFQYYTVYSQSGETELTSSWNDFFSAMRNSDYFITLYDQYVKPDQEILDRFDITLSL